MEVGAKNTLDNTLLHFAALQGFEKVVEVLLNNRVDISGRGQDGTTPMHMAARMGHEKVVKFLLRAGADTTTMDNTRYTL